MSKKQLLVLCTGNSARSQMAEGLVNHLAGDEWMAHSAGTKPAGYVHPLAVEVMAEQGIDISGQESKPVANFQGRPFDLVLTVCDDAAKNCPLWLGQDRVQHVGFPDPAAAEGGTEEKLATFRHVRDGLREKILPLLEEIGS